MENETTNSLYVGKKYQWIKGDTVSKVETIVEETEKSGMPFLSFKDGKGIFVTRLKEYMIEFNGSDSEASATNQTLNKPVKIAVTNQPVVTPIVVEKTTHPLQGLLDLMKKREVTLHVNSSTPTMSHFKMLIENYEIDDILDLLSNNIYNELVSDPNATKDYIREELKKLYKLEI